MTRCPECRRLLWPWQRQELVAEMIDGGAIYSARVHFLCAVAWIERWLKAAEEREIMGTIVVKSR
jgi:hypothetical protein